VVKRLVGYHGASLHGEYGARSWSVIEGLVYAVTSRNIIFVVASLVRREHIYHWEKDRRKGLGRGHMVWNEQGKSVGDFWLQSSQAQGGVAHRGYSGKSCGEPHVTVDRCSYLTVFMCFVYGYILAEGIALEIMAA
jgi:hypothetical protein